MSIQLERLSRNPYLIPPSEELPHSPRTHFEDWERYHRPWARMHGAHLHGHGIATGLGVQVEVETGALIVAPGVAVDAQGELVVLAPDGRADISTSEPGEFDRQIAAPFRLPTAGRAPGLYALTIQFNEQLDFVNATLEHLPWLRLQAVTAEPPTGDAVVLAISEVGSDGGVRLHPAHAAAVAGRQVVPAEVGQLTLRQPVATATGLTDIPTATLRPTTEGSLAVTIAGPTLSISQPAGSALTAVQLAAETVSATGNLSIGGALQVSTLATAAQLGIGTSTPTRPLTIQGSAAAHVNLRAGEDELLLTLDGGGGQLATTTLRPLRLGAGEQPTALTITPAGQVGIGVAEPGERLTVDGTINATGYLLNGTPLALSPWAETGTQLSYTAGNVGIGTATPTAALEVRADWDGEEGALRLSGDKPTLRFTGGEVANNQSWIMHVGSDGPGGLGFYHRRRIRLRDPIDPPIERGAGEELEAVAAERPFPGFLRTFWASILSLAPSGNVGIGASTPEARLHILNTPQDANGNTLILGPTNGANLRLGYAGEYSWIQSHGSRPLAINPIGNNVGVGTTAPAVRLHVVGNRIRLTKAGNAAHQVELRADGSALDLESSFDLYLNNNGVPIFYRNMSKVSSRALKEEIKALAAGEAAQLLDELQPVRFRYKEGPGEPQLGFIAEEVPAIVASGGRKGIDPMAIIAILCGALREQRAELTALQHQVYQV